MSVERLIIAVTDSDKLLRGKNSMKTAKAKTAAPSISQPVWCQRCCIRIAPYDLRTVYQGRDYHRDCFVKLSQENGKARKN